jgi:hypothetical protein
MPLKRVWMPSPNYSSRSGTVRLIVIHSSEGAQTYQSLGNFFAKSSSGVSSHTGIDNSVKGTIGEYVKRPQKAWTQGNANSVAIATELCTPSGASANWSTATWQSKTIMLDNCAQWVAEEAAYYGIPIVKLTASQAQGSGRGVCQHRDLGAWGGGHVDCGPNFPIDQVISMAKQYAAGTTPTPPTPTPQFTGWEEDMIIISGNDTLQLIYGGEGSYWRPLPPNAAKLIPDSMKIKDDGSLRGLWKVGAKG